MAIIVLAFIPVFALTGQEGKLFHPLAFTKTFAVMGATLLAVTLVPVLCTLLLGGRMHDEGANPVMRLFRRLYRPLLEWALSHRVVTLAAAMVLFVGALGVGSRIGSEFMPPLNEGDLLFMPIGLLMLLLPISISGFGVPQGIIVWLLRPVGVPAPLSLALSTLIILTGLAGNLPGLWLWLRQRREIL